MAEWNASKASKEEEEYQSLVASYSAAAADSDESGDFENLWHRLFGDSAEKETPPEPKSSSSSELPKLLHPINQSNDQSVNLSLPRAISDTSLSDLDPTSVTFRNRMALSDESHRLFAGNSSEAT